MAIDCKLTWKESVKAEVNGIIEKKKSKIVA